jgi:hypothetical protein
MIIYSLIYFAAALLIWFAVQSIKHPMPQFDRAVERTWQTILLAAGVGLIVSTFFF